ncbi:MAG: thioredoxin-disulfide reductase [Candidatus Omnitrophota bacterium]
MSETLNDLIIIGAGPAGLTGAIYASREMIETLLLEKGICGGIPATVDLIENYPGFPKGINGIELMDKLKEQAEKFGSKILEYKEIEKIEAVDGKIKVYSGDDLYTSKALIVASGSLAKTLGIKGEEEYKGRGVSYCATCDGPLYRGKDVAVVGGGNAALEEAVFLTKFARKVIIIHRRDELRAAKIVQEELRNCGNAEFLLSYRPISINGKDRVASITVEHSQTKQKKDVDVSGVFIYIGAVPNTGFLKGVIELDDLGYIKTDEKMRTSAPGIYAAGDVRSGNLRQITVACGEAAIAAISVRDYLKNIKV